MKNHNLHPELAEAYIATLKDHARLHVEQIVDDFDDMPCDSDIEELADDYIGEAQDVDGKDYWEKFSDYQEIAKDFKLYLKTRL